MGIYGYDAWKQTAEDEGACEHCGASAFAVLHGWEPPTCNGDCGRQWRDPDHAREEMREAEHERPRERQTH